MKPRNFPARKAARKLAAELGLPVSAVQDHPQVLSARAIRTKKKRGQ